MERCLQVRAEVQIEGGVVTFVYRNVLIKYTATNPNNFGHDEYIWKSALDRCDTHSPAS